MSTRSFICKEQPDGSLYGIYCHWDGYLTYNGALLLDHYSDKQKLEELLALGYISSLREKVVPDPSRQHSFDFDKQQEDVTVAYARDRGEELHKAKTITFKQAQESECEYMYIFGKDGKWKYYDLSFKYPELQDVESALNADFEEMGIQRPVNLYGDFSQEDIAKIKAEQAQLQKNNVVM